MCGLCQVLRPSLKPFFPPYQDFPCIAVVGLGKSDAGVCGAENWDLGKESVRQAVSSRTTWWEL